MRVCGWTALIAVVLVSVAGMAAAEEVRVLGVDAVAQPLRALAVDFTKATGHRVVFTIAPPAVVMKKIAAKETHDAVIVASRPWTTSKGTASSNRKAACGSPMTG
jgi:ABC-type molybdate transport system substrate-binding protein